MSTVNDAAPGARRPPLPFTRRGCFTCVLLGSITFVLLLPEWQAAREAERRQQCVYKIRGLGLALGNYHDVYGCFPPPYVADANGRPMHSWRVAIIPFLLSSDFHRKYDFNAPWDSPANFALARTWCTSFNPFVCPSAHQTPDEGFTSYVMIVGPDGRPERNDTILVAEIADSDILWSEPRDLKRDEMSLQINDRSKPGISSHHPLGAMVVFSDGSVHFLEDSTTRDQLKAMLPRKADQ